MTKTYNVADYATKAGTQLVIILDQENMDDVSLWVQFVKPDGSHDNHGAHLASRWHLSNHRTADLLA